MKRILSLFLLMILIAVLAGCSAAPPAVPATETPTEPAPQLHTIAPADSDSLDWAMIDADLSLQTDEFLLADGDDFVGFAIVGSGSDAALRFRFTADVAAMLAEQDSSLSYFIAMGGERLGAAELSDDCTEATLIASLSSEELVDLANRIRGF